MFSLHLPPKTFPPHTAFQKTKTPDRCWFEGKKTMATALTQSPIFYQDILEGREYFASIVLFDSAPVICCLTDNTGVYNKWNTADPDVVRKLVWAAYPHCKPLKIITIVALPCHVAVITHSITEDLTGVVDPRRIIFNRRDRGLISSLRFRSPEAAGRFVHFTCIGFHIVSLGRYGTRVLSPPRYSGTYVPFHRPFDLNQAGQNPEDTEDVLLDIYGPGFTIVENAQCCRPAQVSPFVCRPINATRDDRANFEALARVIFCVDLPGVVTDRTNFVANTDIGFYRTPFRAKAPAGWTFPA